jgi:hypothetical protein
VRGECAAEAVALVGGRGGWYIVAVGFRCIRRDEIGVYSSFGEARVVGLDGTMDDEGVMAGGWSKSRVPSWYTCFRLLTFGVYEMFSAAKSPAGSLWQTQGSGSSHDEWVNGRVLDGNRSESRRRDGGERRQCLTTRR